MRARRVFEETLERVQAQYAPTEDVIVEVRLPDASGQTFVVARYRICVDGRVECFQVLDEVLWPSL